MISEVLCIFFHYSELKPKGRQFEGIYGFLKNDILNLVKNNSHKICYICQENNALSKCEKCSKMYHYTCGRDNGATFIFSRNPSSYCEKHFPNCISKHKISNKDRICSNCGETKAEDNKKDCCQNPNLTM